MKIRVIPTITLLCTGTLYPCAQGFNGLPSIFEGEGGEGPGGEPHLVGMRIVSQAEGPEMSMRVFRVTSGGENESASAEGDMREEGGESVMPPSPFFNPFGASSFHHFHSFASRMVPSGLGLLPVLGALSRLRHMFHSSHSHCEPLRLVRERSALAEDSPGAVNSLSVGMFDGETLQSSEVCTEVCVPKRHAAAMLRETAPVELGVCPEINFRHHTATKLKKMDHRMLIMKSFEKKERPQTHWSTFLDGSNEESGDECMTVVKTIGSGSSEMCIERCHYSPRTLIRDKVNYFATEGPSCEERGFKVPAGPPASSLSHAKDQHGKGFTVETPDGEPIYVSVFQKTEEEKVSLLQHETGTSESKPLSAPLSQGSVEGKKGENHEEEEEDDGGFPWDAFERAEEEEERSQGGRRMRGGWRRENDNNSIDQDSRGIVKAESSQTRKKKKDNNKKGQPTDSHEDNDNSNENEKDKVHNPKMASVTLPPPPPPSNVHPMDPASTVSASVVGQVAPEKPTLSPPSNDASEM